MEGSEEARREFIARYEGLVWRTVMARLSRAPREDQEEVVANTFIALLADNAALLGRYNPKLGLSPEGYIRRQAILQGINRYRSLSAFKRRIEVPLDPDPDAPGHDTHADTRPDPEMDTLDREAVQTLLHELQESLTPALAVLFELMYVRELEPAEIAATLGCSMEVVYTRKKRLVDALHRLLEERDLQQAGKSS